MADIYVKYQYDPTGNNPNNLVTGERHSLDPVSGFPYKIITMNHGGFYARSVRVYDADYNRLVESEDYILTYRYAHISQMLGLEICNDIVFLDKARTGTVYVSAQVVGGDVAFSLTGIVDYVTWYNQQEEGYVPRMFDYNGNEPVWLPGELDQERWRLDTYQPFNNEIYELARAAEGGRGIGEDKFRSDVLTKYNEFISKFNDRLERHIDDKANPHSTTKNHIKLGLLQNYTLATVAESQAGDAIDLYQTPELTWKTLEVFAQTPLVNHTSNTANPHQTTPAKIDAPTKQTVDTTVNGKYLVTETVVDAVRIADSSSSYNYLEYFNYIRSNIPSTSFVVNDGYLDPYRLGRGTPGPTTVLRSGDTPRWTPIAALLIEYNPKVSPGLLFLDTSIVPANSTPVQGFNIAINQPWAFTAVVGSIICYKLGHRYVWGTGNGAGPITYRDIYMAYKSPNGWVRV